MDSKVSSDGRDDFLTSVEHQFSEFEKEYDKTYPTQEEDDYRFGVFISNLRRARRDQIMDPTAVYGVTQFSDLTPSEFKRRYAGGMELLKDGFKTAPLLPVNWNAKDAVTPVKSQVNSVADSLAKLGLGET
ncbi:hypothetical protein Ddye_007161 [Dipteronia dyeriana]|uniref:Cathepsin propeptide inhibitor domain-containing protein n=1 Tax=Dipteronia dyeriana TaxID=168575 RepID=A0AAE0CRW0_9ROSI|nr:hypothetical protein Ddye_007161 [Dipteronia dyeriana]